jgi:hypothetical protein
MQANGYVPREPSASPVATVSSAPPPAPLLQAAYSAPRETETLPTSRYPSAPLGRPAAANLPANPAPEGEPVLFPVTIYTRYHPSWTVQ